MCTFILLHTQAVLKLREEVGHDAGFLEFPFTIDVTNTSSISHAVADVEEYYPDEIDVLVRAVLSVCCQAAG